MKTLRPQITVTCLFTTITLAVAAFAVDPPPDGGYPNMNTAEGEDALFKLTTGVENTALGFQALYNNTGSENTATGSLALFSNTTGNFGTATGWHALEDNTTGYSNTAFGSVALSDNTTGGGNVAVGSAAAASNTTGSDNTAVGSYALARSTTGSDNTAVGAGALEDSKTSGLNTAVGCNAARLLTSGGLNTALGEDALGTNKSGNGNIALGAYAGTEIKGSNNIDIGHRGSKFDVGTIRLGTSATQTATYIAGISGTTVAGGVGVVIDTEGHLGTVVSSARFKDEVKPMDRASEGIFSLQPVTFRYKHELDPKAIPQYGLVAEQVAKVNPDLVARDGLGQPFTVRYEAVNAMLLNEFLKEHQKVEAQSAIVHAQEKELTAQRWKVQSLEEALAQQQAQIKALTEGLQKVSAQMQTRHDAPRLVSTDLARPETRTLSQSHP